MTLETRTRVHLGEITIVIGAQRLLPDEQIEVSFEPEPGNIEDEAVEVYFATGGLSIPVGKTSATARALLAGVDVHFAHGAGIVHDGDTITFVGLYDDTLGDFVRASFEAEFGMCLACELLNIVILGRFL